MKIHGVKRQWSSPFFSIRKHRCPICNERLEKIKTEIVVNSKSDEAKNYDFSNGDGCICGNTKFITTGFRCNNCHKIYPTKELKKAYQQILLLHSFRNKSRKFSKNSQASEISNERQQMNDFVCSLCDNIYKKCEYGDAMEKLNEHERVFYITQSLEQEVNNGGFSQFFYNSSGDFSNELVDAFTKIGALKTAEICKKALAVFDGAVPTDKNLREDLVDSLDCCDDVWHQCDDAFYDYEDNLEKLNYLYVLEHLNSFDIIRN